MKAPMINPMSMERVGGDANGEKTQLPQPTPSKRPFIQKGSDMKIGNLWMRLIRKLASSISYLTSDPFKVIRDCQVNFGLGGEKL